jgi:hypothetical protein
LPGSVAPPPPLLPGSDGLGEALGLSPAPGSGSGSGGASLGQPATAALVWVWARAEVAGTQIAPATRTEPMITEILAMSMPTSLVAVAIRFARTGNQRQESLSDRQ